MKKEQKHESMAAALAAAQLEMTNAEKDSINPHFKNQYASLSAIRDIVVPACNRHGIAVVQAVSGEGGACTVSTSIMWDVQTIEVSRCSLPVGGGRNAAQDCGAISSYLRRYQLAALGGITQIDTDAEGVHTAAPVPSQPANGGATPPTGRNREEAPPQSANGGENGVPSCPSCAGPMWDDRARRLEQQAERDAGTREKAACPAFKCKDKAGCGGVVWQSTTPAPEVF